MGFKKEKPVRNRVGYTKRTDGFPEMDRNDTRLKKDQLMDAPANTMNYMIAGYAVIFTIIIGYLVSLWLRWQRSRQEMELLEVTQRLETEGKAAEKP